jgi:diazepam-binding inhibitor (GABA receptor modulating acyl-CoA-binding protein)
MHIYIQAFEQAAKEVHDLTSKPSNDDLLKLYALYKQATIGDNETSKLPFSYQKRRV